MAKKKVFVSYDYDNDKHYKNLLLAWDANDNFDFNFSDQSADIGINSTNAAAIKRAISAKINNAPHFFCIIGEETHNSHWVCWEIDKAVELEKKIVAVKTDAGNTSPDNILGVGASWAKSFTEEAILNALNNV